MSASNTDDEITFGVLAKIFWRSKWLIAFCTILTVGAGGYYAYIVAEPRFSATAIIEFKGREKPLLDFESVLSGSSTDSASINTEIEIIKSRKIAEEVVRRLNLTEMPEFNTSLQPKPAFDPKAMLRELLGLTRPSVSMTEEERKAAALRKSTAKLRESVVVSGGRDSYLFPIKVEASRPYVAANIANMIAEVYIEDQLAKKFAETEQAIDWLSDRARELEEELRVQENKFKVLQSESDLISREALLALNLQIKEFRERLNARRQDLADSEMRTGQLEKARDENAKSMLLLLYDDPILNRLGNDLDDTLQGESNVRQTFISRLDQLETTARSNEARINDEVRSLTVSLERLEQSAAEQSEDLQKIDQMERELSVTRDLYQTFLTGLQEATVQIGLVRADAQVMTSALPPQSPFAPRRSLILMASVIAGLVLGAAIALIKMMRDQSRLTVRTSRDLQAVSDIKILGEIPKMPVRRRQDVLGYLQKHPTSASVEAVRNLRTSVLMSSESSPHKVIMLTSTVPGEGKTTVALALTENLAGLGKKVLLVEGDIRRRTLNTYFPKLTGGSNIMRVLEGEDSLSEAVCHDKSMGVDILLGAKSNANPADLFASEAFRNFLKDARETYDYVCIDTPPVLIVPDARIIGQSVDSVIYCVKWNDTPLPQVQAGIYQLDMVGIKISGFALTQIDTRQMATYSGVYGGYGGYGGVYESNGYYKN